MIHIESKSGKSYPIADMSEQHILRTIDVLVERCKKINAASDNNPRYLDDIHDTFDRLSKYYFIATLNSYMNPITENNIEYVYEKYREIRADLFIPSQ
jgi:hypothetical protein